jgi:hypothetical protein
MKYLKFLFILLVALFATQSSKLFAQAANTPAARESAADSITIHALKAAPGKGSIYEIGFVTRDTLATDAEILLAFPPECDLSGLEIAGSSSIDGGWKLEKNGRNVTLRRTGLGHVVMPGRRAGVKLGLIKNPADFNATHRVEVEVRASAKKQAGAKAQGGIAFK